ncbi:MAG: cupin domain-containing protein [Firmicutes bacterium]|nr:cupin domain-containing protein [Bacillota bacterium]
MKMGERLRAIRTAKGLTLREVSQLSGLSLSYIAQIERDEVNPSISSLRKLTDSLGIKLSALFDETEEEPTPRSEVLVRSHERKALVSGNRSVRQYLLAAMEPRAMEPMWTEVEVGGSSGDELYSHEGEEFGILLKGALRVTVGQDVYVLGPGDSMYFKSTEPHRFENVGGETAVMVWVVCPPSW